ncbi:hypothetical protein Hanom_Chr17g01545481 [Helianthus anomalus]
MKGDVAVVREVGDEVKTLENQKSFLLEPMNCLKRRVAEGVVYVVALVDLQ